jgi:hypothetical protein
LQAKVLAESTGCVLKDIVLTFMTIFSIVKSLSGHI